MNNRNLALSLLIITTLFTIACGLFSSIADKYTETKGTAQSVVTDVQQGQSFLETAKAVATQVGDSGFMSTAMVLATEAKESGYLETAQAYITSEGPAALETVQAFATEQGPSMIQTGQAYATELGLGNNELPPDIPVVSADKEMYFSSQELVSYITIMDFQSVLAFYKNEMPNNGWTKVEQGWAENSNSAAFYFEKSDRSVSITLSINPVDNKTVVMITITPK